MDLAPAPQVGCPLVDDPHCRENGLREDSSCRDTNKETIAVAFARGDGSSDEESGSGHGKKQNCKVCRR